jgi:hypothetical protein
MAGVSTIFAQEVHILAPDSIFVITSEMVHSDEIPDPCDPPAFYQWMRGSSFLGSEVSATLTIVAANLPAGIHKFERSLKCGDCGHLIYSPKILVQMLQPAPTGTNGAVCGAGTVTLSASSAGAEIDWYDQATGGILLASATDNYTTPSLSVTTAYYAEARHIATGAVSAERTAVVAVVNTLPDNPTGTDGISCNAGTVDISASSD